MTMVELQRKLDLHVLRCMEERLPECYKRTEIAFPLSCFTKEPYITKDMARAICRSLTDRGYAFFAKGLWTEDGEMAGAGYGITDKGAAYLEELFSEQDIEVL